MPPHPCGSNRTLCSRTHCKIKEYKIKDRIPSHLSLSRNPLRTSLSLNCSSTSVDGMRTMEGVTWSICVSLRSSIRPTLIIRVSIVFRYESSKNYNQHIVVCVKQFPNKAFFCTIKASHPQKDSPWAVLPSPFPPRSPNIPSNLGT